MWSRRDFLRNMGGAVAFSAFLAGGAEFLAACGGGSTTSTQNAVKGGHLIEGDISDIGNVNPIFVNDTASQIVAFRLYEPLVVYDGAGNLQPNLATTVPKADADGVTYKVTLKSGLKWSDGQPITADDVAFTYSLMFSPQYKAVKSRYTAQLTQYLASVTAVDQQTVVFKTTSAYAPMVSVFMALPLTLPKHVWSTLQPAEINSTTMNQLPTVVNGAFQPDRWDKGTQYLMKRNDLAALGKPNLDGYAHTVLPDQIQIANQLRTGQIDVGIFDPGQWDALATASNIDRVGYVRPSYDYYVHNLDPDKTPKAAIFGDVQVRRALLTALNRAQIAQKAYFGQAVAADSSLSSARWVHVTPKTQYPFNVGKAQQMLDAAGWVKGADGIRAKNGVRMEWELRTNAGNKVRENLITVLADQWSQIGVKVTPLTEQFQQLVTRLTQTRDFQMILLGISEQYDPDDTQLWSSKSIGNGALNGAAYKNPQVDTLLDQGVKELDRNKRKAIYAQIQEILMEDLPAPLVTFPKATWGVSKRVKNFNIAAWNTYGPRPWFKDVYVTDGK